MGLQLRLAGAGRERHGAQAHDADLRRGRALRLVDRRKQQPLLPPARQLEIDLGGELGVEQRAVQAARREIDAEALAQLVERIARPGEPALGDVDRVDCARGRDRRAAVAVQLGIEEFEVEARIVDDQRRVADELQELLDDMGEERLVGKEGVGDAVDCAAPLPACRARD